MSIAEVEELALKLSDADRALLVDRLADSLPTQTDDDWDAEGLAEAERRTKEFEADPSVGISLDELKQMLEARRR